MSDPVPAFDAASFLKTLTGKPGVYRMLDVHGGILYVGKARNLKKRVASYFRPPEQLGPKTRAMMAQMRRVEVSVTHTEGEALLLENNQIKEFSPRYNILLRDDKSYPYIHLSSEHPYPSLALHRGARRAPGRYFGPYPSAGAVRESLNLLQKLFRVRQCENGFFRNRTRPCLQYQIERCTGPCVGLVSEARYREDVAHAILFLEGKSGDVVADLVRRMEAASNDLEFEQAARYRDQITSLQKVQERQYVTSDAGDLDVIAAANEAGTGCVQVFFIRGGRNLGNKGFFPRHIEGDDEAAILRAFLTQYYLSAGGEHRIPGEILVSSEIEDCDVLSELLQERVGHRVRITPRVRGERARWLAMASDNARLALAQRLSAADSVTSRLEVLRGVLNLAEPPGRIECFDISHSHGEATVASCVVFTGDGPANAQYRQFNIKDVQPGDDYGAMRQALTRRYTRVRREQGRLPDLLLIDGGKGQVGEAVRVMEELQATEVVVVGVAKGPARRPGMENLFLPGQRQPLILPPDSPALHLIQQIRDEAHRFAITVHRRKRAKRRNTSTLEDLPGIGPKRRQRLLKQFGGLHGVARAGVDDLARVAGISRQLAQSIYDTFHADG